MNTINYLITSQRITPKTLCNSSLTSWLHDLGTVHDLSIWNRVPFHVIMQFLYKDHLLQMVFTVHADRHFKNNSHHFTCRELNPGHSSCSLVSGYYTSFQTWSNVGIFKWDPERWTGLMECI